MNSYGCASLEGAAAVFLHTRLYLQLIKFRQAVAGERNGFTRNSFLAPAWTCARHIKHIYSYGNSIREETANSMQAFRSGDE